MVTCRECIRKATHNFKGSNAPVVCCTHKEEKMVDLTRDICEDDTCIKRAQYNFEGETKGLYCTKHKKKSMTNVLARKCRETGCKTQPSFNYKGLRPIVCETHKEEGMENVTSKNLCEICKQVNASYNYKGIKRPIRCEKHKEPNMICLYSKYCGIDGCKIVPSFNYKGLPALVCEKHKEERMINVARRHCLHEDCDKFPCFNFQGEKKGIYCVAHKKEGMQDCFNKFCECGVRASFANEEETVPKFCAKHKTETMVNVYDRNNKCAHLGCKKLPHFNFKGEKAKYCFKHMEKGMENVKTKLMCEKCSTYPIFGYIEDNKRRCCSLHKKEGMVDLGRHNKGCEICGIRANFNFQGEKKGIRCKKHIEPHMIDIERHYCEICPTSASYGYPHQMATRCAKHIEPNMIIHPNKFCKGKDENGRRCRERAIYGYSRHEYCEDHKVDGMKNFLERVCESCGLLTIISEQTKKCQHCNEFIKIKVHRSKEMEIKLFLDTNHFSYISHDRALQNSTLRTRPDFLFEGKDAKYYVILEVDEMQHDLRPEHCECVRMVNLSQELKKPTIFIRYNPDKFTTMVNNNEKKVHNPGQTKRHKLLSLWLKSLLEKDLEQVHLYGYLSFVQLFYDNYEENKVEVICITPYEL